MVFGLHLCPPFLTEILLVAIWALLFQLPRLA